LAHHHANFSRSKLPDQIGCSDPKTGERDRTAGKLTAPSREEVVIEWSSAKLCDVVNLFLGTILFFSPWLFSLSLGTLQQTDAIAGLLIAVLSIAALTAFAIWEEWLNLIAGLWLIASPWLLGFQDSNAMTFHVVIGAVVAALAAFEVSIARLASARLSSISHYSRDSTTHGIAPFGKRLGPARDLSQRRFPRKPTPASSSATPAGRRWPRSISRRRVGSGQHVPSEP
jgi:hypothetical protein